MADIKIIQEWRVIERGKGKHVEFLDDGGSRPILKVCCDNIPVIWRGQIWNRRVIAEHMHFICNIAKVVEIHCHIIANIVSEHLSWTKIHSKRHVPMNRRRDCPIHRVYAILRNNAQLPIDLSASTIPSAIFQWMNQRNYSKVVLIDLDNQSVGTLLNQPNETIMNNTSDISTIERWFRINFTQSQIGRGRDCSLYHNKSIRFGNIGVLVLVSEDASFINELMLVVGSKKLSHIWVPNLILFASI